MSDEPEEIKLKRITIKTESGSKWFDSPEKLQSWVQQQRQLYKTHQQNSQQKQHYQIQQLFSVFEQSWTNLHQQITNGLLRFKSDPNNYNKRVDTFINDFSNYLDSNQLFTEDNPHTDFFQQQADKSIEHCIAAMAVCFEFNITQIDRNMYIALQEADAYFAGNEERVLNDSNSLQQLKEQWDDEFTKQRDNWVLKYQTKIDESNQLNSKADGLISEWAEQTETQTADLNVHIDSFKSKFDEELTAAKSELENITKTYDDKLALHAAVKYWGIQQKSHNNKAIWFAIALGIMTLVVIFTIVGFSYLTLDAPLKEIHLSKIFTAAALTTFGIWLIKILANIFMSHLHLSTDAQERRTMIHTYLALTRKGQGPKEEDRQLILQTLFRPSATDMVKNDQGPTQLVDMINRLSPKSK